MAKLLWGFSMREGSLDAPIRHPIPWQDPDFINPESIDAELRRVFDICHGCRRCFNLCDSFPRLFDLIDESKTGELDSVESKDFKPVIDACTLCDMCFMTKCPYVPPHEFNLDFPHLMLRYRVMERAQGKIKFVHKQLTQTDRNGKLAGKISPLVNWASDNKNKLTRPAMEKVAGIDREAALPKFCGKTFSLRAKESPVPVNEKAPAFGRRAVIYATCFANYNSPDIGMAALQVLAQNGVETSVEYPSCCGMPQLETGDLAGAAEKAKKVAKAMRPWIEKGYDIIGLVPSCTLMMKFEWPLLLPDDDDIKLLSKASFDISEYVVNIAGKEGLSEGLTPLEGGASVHIACHARAQNMGQKAAEMLRLIPQTPVDVIERCSGHGGSWGVMKEFFEVALKVGKPVARTAKKNARGYLASECPLAGEHIVQGIARIEPGETPDPKKSFHPIELLALAYGLYGPEGES